MAVLIDQPLTAAPTRTKLPSGPIRLFQTNHSDLGGENATIVYSLDGRNNVMFVTPNGPAKQMTLQNVAIPAGATERTDVISLVERGAGTGLDQVEIEQEITGEDNRATDSITLTILPD